MRLTPMTIQTVCFMRVSVSRMGIFRAWCDVENIKSMHKKYDEVNSKHTHMHDDFASCLLHIYCNLY
jgi:hypothetical protein